MHSKTFLLRPALFVCLYLPFLAAADVLHLRAGFDCQPARDRLILTYDSAFNYAGEIMAEKASATQWKPDVTYDDNSFVSSVRSSRGVCRLSDGEYRIEIYPKPGNANALGRCGAFMGAGAKVEKDGKTLFDGDFDDSCHRLDWPIIHRVLIRPGRVPLKRVSRADEDLRLMFVVACQPEYRQLRLEFVFGMTRRWGETPPAANRIEDMLDRADNAIDLEASCRLGDSEYRYVLHPFIPEGKSCGAARWGSAHLTITRDGETIFDAPFTKDCSDPEAPVLRGVTVRPGKEPAQDTLPAALFYDPENDEEYERPIHDE
ncbi:MAG: hypothetical protein LBJ59_10540 [Zoogloeaceae bacterium]|jgi:hypothetical protein|nr:hypothetical protein [Zoogloeaceae bacterium]